jgi:hypothetical protein
MKCPKCKHVMYNRSSFESCFKCDGVYFCTNCNFAENFPNGITEHTLKKKYIGGNQQKKKLNNAKNNKF